WTNLWTRFPATTIDRDMKHARWLGANTIRIFLQPSIFGFEKPKTRMLDRFEELLQIAQRHHIQVAVSLFDGWHDYDDVKGSESWARAILQSHADDRRIAFVEVQNEVNPNDKHAMSWASHMIADIHSFAPLLPLTISAPGKGGADTLALLKRHVGSD